MDLGLGFIYRLLRDIYGYITRNQRKLSRSEIVDLRTKWKGEFENEIRERHFENLRSDVIIRDVNRVDEYPSLSDKKGISSWFKAGLVGTYHRGIQLLLEWVPLVQEQDGNWRYPKSGEEPTLTAGLVGLVKFENIQQVNWDGDEYYGLSHIFCHFVENRKEPYEQLVYCDRRELDGWPYFTQLTTFEEVEKVSKVHKLKNNS